MKNFQIVLLLITVCLFMAKCWVGTKLQGRTTVTYPYPSPNPAFASDSEQWTPIYGAMMNIPAWTCALSMGENGEAVQKVFLLQKLTTHPEKCLQYCAFRALGMMDGTKVASQAMLVAIYLAVHVGLLDKMLNAQRNVYECTNEDLLAGKTDPCEIAATIAECFRKQG